MDDRSGASPVLGGTDSVARIGLRARGEIPDLLRVDPAEEVTMSVNNAPKRCPLCLGLAVPLLAVISQASAAEKATPPPIESGPRMLHAYLLAECQKHFNARRQT